MKQDLDRSKMEAKLAYYEPLVKSTVKRHRNDITWDLSEEDIAQELRMKIWRALLSFDPDRWPGTMSDQEKERRHVFGAMFNRVKDLKNKKKRDEEWLTGDLSGDASRTQSYDCEGSNNRNSVERKWLLADRVVDFEHPALSGISELNRYIAIMIYDGYSKREIVENFNLVVDEARNGKIDEYRDAVNQIQEALSAYR